MTVEIFLGRWQDVLPGTYDPDRAVVVTDPPYGLGDDGGKGYADSIPWAAHVSEIIDNLPAKRHVIRGPATALVQRDYPQPRRICVEVAAYRRRRMLRPGTVPYLWQGWAIYGRLRVDRHAQQPTGDALASRNLVQSNEGDIQVARSEHRALTPYASALWIIDNWVDPGDIVIDPFAGHGTIGRAARQHGFDYLGSEMVPEYHRIAEAGFSIERLVLGLESAS